MDFFSIISGLLLPLLAKCFQGVSSDDPRQYLRDHYDSSSDSFDSGLVADCMPQTYRAIRKARRQCNHKDRKNFPQYSRDQVYKMTEESLRDAMKADDAAVAAVMAAAGQLSGVDD